MWPRVRLRQVLFTIFTLIASLPVVILAVWVQQSALDKEIAAVEEKHLLVAHNLTGDLARYIVDIESSFRLIAKNLILNNDIAGASEHLDSLYLRYVDITNTDGVISKQVVASSVRHSNQLSAKTLQILLPIMQQSQANKNKIFYSDMVRTGDDETTFYLLQALQDNKYVVAALSTNHIIAAQKKVSFGRRGHAAIVDRTGRAIAHPIPGWVKSMKDMSFLPPVSKMMQGETGVSKFFTPAMQADMVAGYTTVPRVGWGVMIPQPFEELQERANDVQIIALAIALGGIAIAGMISWYIAGILSHPIQSVVDASKFKSHANKNLILPEVSTSYRFIPHELRELLQSFNLMRSKLNDMTSKLHSEVETAVAEVKSQNIQLQKYSSKLLETNEQLGIEVSERRKAQEESGLQSTRLRSLYSATQLQKLSYSESILRVLVLGCEFFDMSIGRVCEIDESNNTNTVKYIFSKNNDSLVAGIISNLDETYCKTPFMSNDTIHTKHISQSDWEKSACDEYSDLESYLATLIWVNGEKYGTISFSSVQPRVNDFTASDIDFIRIMAQWVGISMERRISVEKDNARSAAVAASEAKGTFLANMSHELRTPINAILGYGEILLEDCEDLGNDQMKQDLEKIQIAGTHLTKLISSILDLSKIEAGKVDVRCENIDITILINEIADTVRPQLMQNQNYLVVNVAEGIGEMISDRTMLLQILLNLLGNAAKFSANGIVRISADMKCTENRDYAVFTVSDAGVGMSPEQLAIIFNEFSQANSITSSENGGIGLGLSISRKYGSLLGGQIDAKSKPGEGSTFTVTLPRYLDETQANDEQWCAGT